MGKKKRKREEELTSPAKEYHNRLLLLLLVFGPDIQRQAVFASILVNAPREGSDDLAELVGGA